jgi:hypothetical protein
MQIVSQTATKLVIQEKQPRISLIFGIIFLILSISVVLYCGQITKLECRRSNISSTLTVNNQGKCELIHERFWGTHTQTFPLGALQGAKMQEDGEGTTFQILLLTGSDQIAFTPYYSLGRENQEKIVEQINNFLQQPEREFLIVQHDDRQWSYILGLILLVIAINSSHILEGIFTSRESWVFDISEGTIFSHQSRWGRATKVSEYPLLLQDIVKVAIEKQPNDDSRYRIVLCLKSGVTLPINPNYSSDINNLKSTCMGIVKFLQPVISSSAHYH